MAFTGLCPNLRNSNSQLKSANPPANLANVHPMYNLIQAMPSPSLIQNDVSL